MTRIRGEVYLLLGAFVSGFSYFMNQRNENQSLLIFIYVGYAFIAYGLARTIISYIFQSSKKEKKQSRAFEQPNYQQQPQQQMNNSLPEGYIGRCRRCNAPMRSVNIYCHRCGLKQ